MSAHLRVALAGNPNVGKSTIFNALTGGQQHVGNWPGKTVERATGSLRGNDHTIELVDLPGAYSLTAYSPEEAITRDYLVQERPDLVVNVVDACNLERNLYLTLQIIETGAPLLLVLTMTDQAAQRGLAIDCAELSAALGGAPVLACVAHQSHGIAELREAVLHHVRYHSWKGAFTCPHCR